MPDGRPDSGDRSEHVVERHVGEELATHPLDDCAGEPHASRVDEAAGHDVGVAGDVPALLEAGGRVVLDRHDDDLGAAGRVDGALAALACGERAAQVVVAGTDDRDADRQTREQGRRARHAPDGLAAREDGRQLPAIDPDEVRELARPVL